MERRPTRSEPQNANLTSVQKRSAIDRLQRRLQDLRAFDPSSVTERYGPEVTQLEQRLRGAIEAVYPAGTVEHRRVAKQASSLDLAPHNGQLEMPIDEVIKGHERGKARCIATLEGLIADFREDLAEEAGDGREAHILAAYKGLDLHPEIHDAASGLYLAGYYASAVESAIKALNNVVRLRGGLIEDGNPLMDKTFGGAEPILAFNDLADEHDQSEQRGYMFLFKGAISGLRNPRAHRLVTDDPERSLEFIAFVSLLAKLAGEAIKRPKP